MSQRRNRRAGVEDRWTRRDGARTARHGTGNRWLARIVDDAGREVTRSYGRKVDAQRWVDEQTAALVTGAYVAPGAGDVTVGDLAGPWLQRHRRQKPSGFRVTESGLRVHVLPAWGDRRISTIAPSEVAAWLTDLGQHRGPVTVIRAHGILASILDDAVKDRRLITNPARGHKMPRKPAARHVYLEHAEVDALVSEVAASAHPDAGQHAVMVALLAYSGLRFGEAAALRICHVDFLRRRLRVVDNAVTVAGKVYTGTPKGHQAREVPVPRFLVDQLAQLAAGRDRDALLFPGPDGGPQRLPYSVDGWFAAAVKRAGIARITPHSLRHVAAAFAIRSGADVLAVQRMLGHKSAALTLDTYSSLFDGALDDVAERVSDDRAAAAADQLRTRRRAGRPG